MLVQVLTGLVLLSEFPHLYLIVSASRAHQIRGTHPQASDRAEMREAFVLDCLSFPVPNGDQAIIASESYGILAELTEGQ